MFEIIDSMMGRFAGFDGLDDLTIEIRQLPFYPIQASH
jgi:hypothetical protein